MTLEELHSRILLHELRAILFDDSRGGTLVPAGYRELIEQSPHEPASYLVLADHFDDDGDVLGELIRIQVELSGGVTFPEGAQWISAFAFDPHNGMETQIKLAPQATPFQNDMTMANIHKILSGKGSPRAELIQRQWEIAAELYSETTNKTYQTIGGETVQFPFSRVVRKSKLGRTTRMLTDVIRYCFMNHGKHVLCILPGDNVDNVENSKKELQFDRLCRELIDREPAWISTHTAHIPDCHIHFGLMGFNQLIRTHRIPRRDMLHHDGNEEALRYVRQQLIAAGFDTSRPIQTEYNIAEHCWASTQFYTPDITFTDHACR